MAGKTEEVRKWWDFRDVRLMLLSRRDLLKLADLIFAAWPQISVCWKNSRRSLPPLCTAPFLLPTPDAARKWTGGPAEPHTLHVFVLTLNFNTVDAVIPLAVQLLN